MTIRKSRIFLAVVQLGIPALLGSLPASAMAASAQQSILGRMLGGSVVEATRLTGENGVSVTHHPTMIYRVSTLD